MADGEEDVADNWEDADTEVEDVLHLSEHKMALIYSGTL